MHKILADCFRFSTYNIVKEQISYGVGLQISLLLYELISNLLDIRSEIWVDSLSNFKVKFIA